MSNIIKAICFDLDGVYFTPRGKKSFHQSLSSEFGVDSALVDDIMYRSEEMRNLVEGRITPADFWEHVRNEAGISATDDDLLARWIRDYEIDAEVQKAVLSAKAQGFLTCVCTNNNAARLPALESKFGFYKDFDVVVSSHEVGFSKPNPEIFKALLFKLGVQPNELIYADDNPERLSGAKDLGIRTFVYKNFAQFLSELNNFGIHLS